MELPVIRKSHADLSVEPNLRDYAAAREAFTWESAQEWIDGLPGGGVNIAYEAVDRHVAHGRGEHVALRCLGKQVQTDITYAELARRTNTFANALRSLGIERGQRVFSLVGRVPALYVAILGTLKAGSVFAPLFSAFGPEPVKQRVVIGSGVAMVTSAALYRKKVAPVRDEMPTLQHILLVDEPGSDDVSDIPGAIHLTELLAEQSDEFDLAQTGPEDMALLHFTSGTTGTPKAAVHVHAAVVAHYATGHFALDLHAEDIYWCTADPGWVTGTSYGVISPLTHGLTMIVDEGEFDARRWYRTLAEQRVSVWYTAPTAIRMLMRAGPELAKEYDLSSVRFVASVGEPLNPEAVVWGREVLGLTIHDNWWQTETGGIMIANYAACDVHPGSMGQPMPGITAGVLQRGEEGRAQAGPDGHVAQVPAGEIGELALRTPWPSMFRAYLDEEQRYNKCFVDGWYLTGDLAKRDEDGYFWFVGRADDVIKTAGHLIGPFEVESVLMEDPRVAEAGVIGVPDPMMGERIKAFVSLKPGVDDDPKTLRRELTAHARRRLGPAVAPREIEFSDNLPKTRSGKIMRRLLKARELGLPEGDLSTLETPGGDSK
ncbi:MAG: acetate--CoA ligase [Actinobacteria bacterium]|nr:acetate--CoA ligase [Actinomycetota bacterium]MCO5299806.1 acetate--CoA ligase [Candidatus Nanopelagicales bacterium]HRY10766.1 acetate--CoA ligase [Candidatus Nanopelagicales bacterium]